MHQKSNQINRQSGFSPIFGLVLIVIVLALGFCAWFIWQRMDQSSGEPTAKSQTDQQTTQSNESDAPPEVKYLEIKELDIKIPLTSQIEGAYYTFHSDGLADYASLYDAGFDQLENANGVSCKEGGSYQIYSISRAKPENIATLDEFAGPEYKSFDFTDEYKYGGLGAHQASPSCSDLSTGTDSTYQGDENILRIVDEKEQAFNQSFNNLKPLD